ncbi:SH3 domain-containing protein [Rhizobium glycinendophyticum]|uniref:SH3 domain-containing protein n=1 Tax=Rhizobium glycinendophyticum TaxID=2589807 RepID=UPI003CCC6E4D
MYVTGNGVAFRAGPSIEQQIIDRFDKGREVTPVGTSTDWTEVLDHLTQRMGWIATRFLSNSPPEQEVPRQAQLPPQKQPPSAPATSDATIVQRIIAQSIANYPGSAHAPIAGIVEAGDAESEVHIPSLAAMRPSALPTMCPEI